MATSEKEIQYTATNTYSTLNQLTENTKTIWLVFHGMGYLSRYFINYFKDLDASENYIIAPQAQSKYYVAPKFKHVGASWLTKENTLKETENVLRNIDAVLENESIPDHVNLNVLGYSQGVSIAMRYLAKRQIQCENVFIHSGGIPVELAASDFNYLTDATAVYLLYGDSDKYITPERVLIETERAKTLFGHKLTIVPFKGEHEVKMDLVSTLIN